MDVLIVDDSPGVVELFKTLVQTLPDTEARGFTSSNEALEWSKSNPCDLALVDQVMPAPNGCEFLKAFRALPGKDELPFVMVTGDTSRDTRLAALRLGATDFLNKPVDALEFSVRIKNLLDLRRRRLELAQLSECLAEEVRAATEGIAQCELETILRLSSAAEYRDPDTGAHISRVARYCRVIAKNLGHSEEFGALLERAAPMHDVGKVGVPDRILLKPGNLNEEEWVIMRSHVTIGHSILSGSVSSLLQQAAEIALTHHEKFDGSGYPHGLAGEDIPITGRITAVADIFDALTSDRPYRTAWTPERAISHLRQLAGHHLDPKCVDAFLREPQELLALQAESS